MDAGESNYESCMIAWKSVPPIFAEFDSSQEYENGAAHCS